MYPGWSPPLPPGPGPNAHQPAPHEQFQAYLSQIATADHPMLVVAENAAYKGVLAERDQLKEDNRALFYQLEASKETINLLKSLAGSNPSSSSSSGSATPKPSLMTSPSVRPGGCHYFEQSEWLAKKQQLQAAGASSAVLTHGYLAEPDGDPCDAQRRRVFNEHMNTHFTQLYHEGRDPAVWSSATAEVVDYLVDGLLRLDSVFISKGNWKPKEALKYQFAIWCSKNRPKLGPRQSSERLPNAHEILKVQKKALRDAVKAKKGSAPPPGTKVINVDDDAAVPASSGTVQVKKEPGEEEKGDGDKPANARVDELEGEKEKMDEPKGDLKDVEVEEPGGDVSSNDDEERDKPGTPPANASGGLPPTTIPSDPFAGLDIPPPNIDIPHIPASPNTIANMSKKRKADSLDGPWDPPKDRFTGKAFYAIEYKEKNPVATERDFEREWKKVAKDVRADYEGRAKTAKAAVPKKKKK